LCLLTTFRQTVLRGECHLACKFCQSKQSNSACFSDYTNLTFMLTGRQRVALAVQRAKRAGLSMLLGCSARPNTCSTERATRRAYHLPPPERNVTTRPNTDLGHLTLIVGKMLPDTRTVPPSLPQRL